jgi:hypothetical protein
MLVKQIANERDVTKKVDLIVKFQKMADENPNWFKKPGLKRFLFRMIKITRCINACYNGDIKEFCDAHTTLDTGRFNCALGDRSNCRLQVRLR